MYISWINNINEEFKRFERDITLYVVLDINKSL